MIDYLFDWLIDWSWLIDRLIGWSGWGKRLLGIDKLILLIDWYHLVWLIDWFGLINLISLIRCIDWLFDLMRCDSLIYLIDWFHGWFIWSYCLHLSLAWAMDRLRAPIWMKGTAKLVSLHWSIVLIGLVHWITLHDWSDAIDHLMAYLMACFCLCVGVVDWSVEWLTERIIDDRPWNPRNPNSMLRNILSHHAPPVGRQETFRVRLEEVLSKSGPWPVEPGTSGESL